MSDRLSRIGVLLSGRGSNFLALHGAMERGIVPAEICIVVSNRASAPGLARAADLGIPTACLPHRAETSRSDHEARVQQALDGAGVDWICLAGYLRLLSADFVQVYRDRILNIHPSLLPAFPGLGAQQQAIDYGVKVSGCTVHLVDEGLDHGPIVVQRAVPVVEGDSEESLSLRILEQEHEAYPEALRRLLTEAWSLEGRRVCFQRASADPDAG